MESPIADLFSQLLGTILLRPYFAAFLLAYFAACSYDLGPKQSFLFAAAGYCIAWVSEYSSIHNGIPYGHYYYLLHTKGKELWVLGVPFMDSMSFVFLSYASYSVALLVANNPVRTRYTNLPKQREIRHSFKVRLLGALFCMYLDVIIDPVALRGDRWFLGQIYGYRGNGVYFGIPISNFVGWFVVGFFLIYALQLIDRLLTGDKVKETRAFGPRSRRKNLLGPCLYLAIVVFNLSVTLAIGEYNLFCAGGLIVLMPLVLLAFTLRGKIRGTVPDEALKGDL